MSRKQHGLDRIVFFSDAVFAIAITLISVEIKLPPEPGQLNSTKLSHNLLNLVPEYRSYIFTFLIIGFYWINHHQYFNYIRHYDYKLIWLNTILLMCVAFLPFSASVLNDYRRQPIAVIFYAGSMIAIGLMKSIMWWYASSNHRLVHKNLPKRLIDSLSFRALVPPIVFLMSMPIAFFSPTLTELSWISIPIVFVLFKRFNH